MRARAYHGIGLESTDKTAITGCTVVTEFQVSVELSQVPTSHFCQIYGQTTHASQEELVQLNTLTANDSFTQRPVHPSFGGTKPLWTGRNTGQVEDVKTN